VADAFYSRPTSVEEALALAGKAGGGGMFVAGGTDVQTYRKQELEHRQHLIDLCAVESLKQVKVAGNELVIGSMTSLDDLAQSKDARDWCSMISAAARAVASPTIRYTATVGGNLLVSNRCTFYNQSRLWRESAGSCLREIGPTCLATGGTDKCYARNVSDLAPALIALDARIDIVSNNGTRTISLCDIYVADGLRAQGGLEAGAIITAVRITLRPIRWSFRKLRVRESIDFTSLTVAGTLLSTGTARICMNGISTSPILIECDPATSTLAEIQSQARRHCKTVDNDLLPLKHRREMIDVYLEDLWCSFTT